MKNILIIFLFLLSFSGVKAQQIVKEYSIALFISAEGEKSEWVEAPTRVFFNYGNDPSKVKLYFAKEINTFSQIGVTTEGKTSNGTEYYELHLITDETKEEILLRYFKEEQYGIMLIDFSGAAIQITNPIE